MRLGRRIAVAALALASTACGMGPLVTDTGYRGTWSRGNDRNVSILAITQAAGTWKVRWTKRSFDGKLVVACDWDGVCVERLNGKVVATYSMVSRFDASTGRLYTDTLESRIDPERLTFRYTDMLEIADGGRTLWNYTVERDGNAFQGDARPKRSFSKVSDSVAEPPHGTER
jgi:hypothetical protein